ncbi:hypothetical protein K491DRAFT_760114 [Lophiostoma macrostomum CBS 122681]|uniref:WD40 repeat-like protein n=1 Tax=Lophiostoma macrostomum CBS 122681 TaxID=1314788 RepID=A0A6A6SYS2_9PLEO|nr:hypothetical protein K491DRAFT_760114 [Lophiostoma macrostomum CBS 122681]
MTAFVFTCRYREKQLVEIEVMDGRELPGFYWDSEKKRYFKVLPGYKAPPDAKYSKENIKKQREADKAKMKEDSHLRQRRKQTVMVPRDKSRLHRVYHDGEIGHRRRSYYQQHVWPSACASQLESHRVLESHAIKYFAGENTSKTIYTVIGEVAVYSQNPAEVPVGADYGGKVRQHDNRHWSLRPFPYHATAIARMTSPVSSINSLPSSGGLVVTTLGAERPPVVYLTDPERDGPYVGQQFTPKSCPTIWTSSPRPNFSVSDSNSVSETTTEHIAVGASTNLLLFSRAPGGNWDSKTVLQSKSDLLALEWLSPNTICTGHRNGRIQIYDIRAKGSARVLRHPAPITQIRRADDFTRLVCAGLCNTLTMYDLRKAQAATEAEARLPHKERKRKRDRKGKTNWKLPFPHSSNYTVRYAYKNADVQGLGMDVCPKLGLVAAADEENRLNVWNMYTGQVVKKYKSVDQTEPERPAEPKRIRCVRFVEDEDGDTSLWATSEGSVMKYGW